MKGPVLYNIGHILPGSFRAVLAGSVKEAKKLYAMYYHISPADKNLKARKWTAAVINESVVHEDRFQIDSLRAEIGYPSAEGRGYNLFFRDGA